MARTVGSIDLATKDVMQGMTLTVRVPRSFTLRTKLACWLIGLAGWVMGVPCEIEMRDDGEIKPGDVVYDRWNAHKADSQRGLMTVEYLHGHMAHCVWFDWQHQLHRRTFKVGSLVRADGAATAAASGWHKGRMGDAYQPVPSAPITPPPPKPKG